MKTSKRVPDIRFKGFTDEWEEKRLVELGAFKSNGVDKIIREDEIPVNLLNYMDVHNRKKLDNKTTKTLMQVTAKSRQIIENDIQKGDVFFTPSSETADDIGRNMVIQHNLYNTVYSYHLMRFRPFINSFSLLYPNYCFDIQNVRNQMRLVAQGVQRFVLSRSNFENIVINLPTINEQDKIASFLTNLDNLIELNERKYEQLEKVKESLLDKMFPRNCKKIPEIRFKGFNEEWYEREFINIFKYERPDKYFVKSEDYVEYSKTPVLTANKAFILGYTNEDRSYQAEKESIIFDDFTLDSKFVNFPYMVKSSAIKILTLNNKTTDNLRFNYELLNKTKFNILGHARHYISVVQYTEAITTNRDEQNKIAKLLDNLDSLISLQKEKCNKLKKVKESLLSKMFV